MASEEIPLEIRGSIPRRDTLICDTPIPDAVTPPPFRGQYQALAVLPDAVTPHPLEGIASKGWVVTASGSTSKALLPY